MGCGNREALQIGRLQRGGTHRAHGVIALLRELLGPGRHVGRAQPIGCVALPAARGSNALPNVVLQHSVRLIGGVVAILVAAHFREEHPRVAVGLPHVTDHGRLGSQRFVLIARSTHRGVARHRGGCACVGGVRASRRLRAPTAPFELKVDVIL
eukprot:scaffold10326_cov31-Tisochrysis_lutea.AAC.2